MRSAIVGAGDNYAFLVAVGDYDRTQLNPLDFTQRDVLDFAGALEAAGYAKENLVLLHDGQDRRYVPERAKIVRELELLLDSLRPDDSLIVAFSGHGVRFADDAASYFCPIDARLDDRGTLIKLEDVYAEVARCRAKKRLLLIDACRNDPQSTLARSRRVVELESLSRPEREAAARGDRGAVQLRGGPAELRASAAQPRRVLSSRAGGLSGCGRRRRRRADARRAGGLCPQAHAGLRPPRAGGEPDAVPEGRVQRLLDAAQGERRPPSGTRRRRKPRRWRKRSGSRRRPWPPPMRTERTAGEAAVRHHWPLVRQGRRLLPGARVQRRRPLPMVDENPAAVNWPTGRAATSIATATTSSSATRTIPARTPSASSTGRTPTCSRRTSWPAATPSSAAPPRALPHEVSLARTSRT